MSEPQMASAMAEQTVPTTAGGWAALWERYLVGWKGVSWVEALVVQMDGRTVGNWAPMSVLTMAARLAQ